MLISSYFSISDFIHFNISLKFSNTFEILLFLLVFILSSTHSIDKICQKETLAIIHDGDLMTIIKLHFRLSACQQSH